VKGPAAAERFAVEVGYPVIVRSTPGSGAHYQGTADGKKRLRWLVTYGLGLTGEKKVLLEHVVEGGSAT